MKRLLIYAIGYALFACLATAALLTDHAASLHGSTARVVTAIK